MITGHNIDIHSEPANVELEGGHYFEIENWSACHEK